MVALVYYGNDPNHIEAAQKAIEDKRANGWPAALVIADSKDAQRNSYDVFVDQERWVPFGDKLAPVPLSPNVGELASAIEHGYQRYQSVRMNIQTSSLDRK